MLLASLAHVTVFPPSIMRGLVASYTLVGPFGGAMELVGVFLLVRHLLSLRIAPKT
jgi:hypothetical protein